MPVDPDNITLEPVKYEDTWDGLVVAMSSTGTAFAANLSSVQMFFRNSVGTIGMSLASPSDITIDNAATWDFTVGEVLLMPLAIGVWSWSIKTTDAGGVGKTRLSGTIEIQDHPTT